MAMSFNFFAEARHILTMGFWHVFFYFAFSSTSEAMSLSFVPLLGNVLFRSGLCLLNADWRGLRNNILK